MLRRRAGAAALLTFVAFAGLQCVQDLIVSPPNVTYVFSLSPDSAVVGVGDTVAPFSGTLTADGRAVTFTPGFTVVAGANAVRVDSLGRLIVLGRGVARVRVRPLSVALPVDTLADTVTVWAVVPRIGLSTARTEDTLTSLQETFTLQATGQTRSGAAIPGVPITWRQISGAGIVTLIDSATGGVRAEANGSAEFEATVDTVHARRTVRVVQRPTSLTNNADTVRLRALGQTRSVSATLRDARANPVANLTPVWLSKNTGIATVAAGGRVQAVGEGTTQVIASYSGGGVSLADTTTVIVQQARLGLLSGDAQTGAVRAALAAPFLAQLVDGAGTALRDSGVTVIFGVTSGGGHFGVATDTLRTADTVRTDVQGQARTTATLGKLTGANTFSASGTGLVGTALTFAASGTPASARTLAADSGLAQTDTAGHTLAGAFVVMARDTFGNAASGARVAFVVTVGGGKFGGSDSLVTATDAQGRARATLTLGLVAGANVVEARAIVPVGSPVIFSATALPGPTVDHVVVSPATPTLAALGATQAFTAQAQDSLNRPLTVQPAFAWSSGTPATATIDATTGVATAVANGTTVITAAGGGKSGTATLTVTQALDHIVVSPATPTVAALGATQAFTAQARDARNQALAVQPTFTWSSGTPGTATIDTSTGVATAVANGTTVITAAAGGKSGTATLTVTQTLDHIVVSPASAIQTTLGATQAFAAVAYDVLNQRLAAQPTFTWSSGTVGTATIDATTGVATAVAYGSTVITAAGGGKSGTATLTVTRALDHIVVSPATPTLTALGATQAFTAQAQDALNQPLAPQPTFTWSSGTLGTATIDPGTGVATAVANGTTVITAAAGGQSGTALMTVSQVAKTFTVTPAGVSLSGVGSATTLSATAQDSLGNPMSNPTLTWTTLNPAVAGVAGGIVTAVAAGQATIRVSAGAVTGYALVTVTAPAATPVNLWSTAASPTGNALLAVWTANPTDAWAVGSGGTAVHFNGTSWTGTLSGTTNSLYGVWGATPGAVYAVGDQGRILRYNGSVWDTLQRFTTSTSLGAIWGASPADIFVAAGAQLYHYNGSAWSPQTTLSSAVNAIWGASGSDVWAVTSGGQIYRYDGSSWAQVFSPTSYSIATVWGTSASNVYIGAGRGKAFRWDGVTWNDITPPSGVASPWGWGSFDFQYVGEFWGPTPTDIYASLVHPSAVPENWIAHYDGTTWAAVRHDATGLYALRGTPGGSIHAVGGNGMIVRGYRATVAVTPASPAIARGGGTVQLAAAAADEASAPISGVTFTWTTSNAGVATVSSSGLVTGGASTGTVTITATAPGGAAGSATVAVTEALDHIVVSPATPTLTALGATQAFTAQAQDALNQPLAVQPAFAWSSATPGTATIDATTGVATAVAYGTTVITAAAGGKSGTVTLTVTQPVDHIVVSPATPTLTALGATQAFTAQAQDALNQPLAPQPTFTWSSGTLGTATIDPGTGVAIAVANGTTVITAAAVGKSGTATLTVAQALDHIVVSPATPTLTALGATRAFTAVAQDALNQPLAVQPSFTWSSGTPGTATIDAGTGLATAVADGTTVITAAAGGQSGTATLTVAAYRLVFVTQPSAIVRNAPFNPTVQVALRDGSGNPIPGASATITLALGSNPGGGSLAGPLSVSTASGVATFAVLSETAAGSGYTLVASASGYVAATSQAFDVAAHGPATTLAFVTQPTSTGYLVNISPSVRVAVQDQYGNAVTSNPASLALTLSTNPSGATLLGGGAVDAVAGVATFANLNLDGAGTGYKLTASVTSGPSVPSVASNSFDVSQIGTLFSGATAIGGMVRDGSTIYFTQKGSTTGAVKMVATTGGPVTTLATDLLQPAAITTDGVNVYWIETADGQTNSARIGRRAIAGGTTETVAGGLNIANGGYWLRYEAGYLYWLQGKTVLRVSASATNSATTTLATDSLAIEDMTVDAGTVYYFTAYRSYSAPGSIRSVPAAGGTSSLVVTNVRDFYGDQGMLVIGGILYFSDADRGCIASVPATGGTSSCRSSMSGLQQGLGQFATDGASLYVILTTGTVPRIYRFPLSDFASATEVESNILWTGQRPLLLLDDRSVYYSADYQNPDPAAAFWLKKQAK